jgi:chaperonin cofactor prefoldin
MDGKATNAAVQQHALRQQAMELDITIKELEGAQKAYKFVGGLMVAAEPAALLEDLVKKRESIAERLSALERAHKS